ncbi:hypothetical protein CGCA056_v007509 [Colletotrichum aenigma]|uniref:uncharacterized protein n=1 Tax=Colletotrichum aenigma TaxID=1215731 RepID=UPI0018725D36|nr:uncharacterized protein CGCA056_v007509 [Colletotrichum aenigma]KAF5521633.1 hypothetical protein CGCA056_v007509 [Colletotrichum aenigma]
MERKEIIEKLASAKSSQRRPIMTMANGDNTWLISIPRPAGGKGKAFYHILQDPWLVGDVLNIYAWILRLRHPHKEAFDSLAGIESWVEEIETSAGGSKDEGEPWLDAVLVTHILADHMHEETLRTFDASTRVFAVKEPAAVISSWKHFDNVVVIPDFVRSTGTTWPSIPEIPSWLSVFRIPDEGAVYPVLYHCMVISFTGADGKSEVILYSPHGVDPDAVEAAQKANPEASALAMIHPLHKTGLTEKGTTLGVTNGLKIVRRSEPKYWLGTHDDKIQYSGLLSWVFNHGRLTLDDGLEEEARETGQKLPKPNLVEVGNGSSYILV